MAMVGRSGAGKSTLVGLMLRFYDPKGGQVLLNGRPLTEYNLRLYRKSLGGDMTRKAEYKAGKLCWKGDLSFSNASHEVKLVLGDSGFEESPQVMNFRISFDVRISSFLDFRIVMSHHAALIISFGFCYGSSAAQESGSRVSRYTGRREPQLKHRCHGAFKKLSQKRGSHLL